MSNFVHVCFLFGLVLNVATWASAQTTSTTGVPATGVTTTGLPTTTIVRPTVPPRPSTTTSSSSTTTTTLGPLRAVTIIPDKPPTVLVSEVVTVTTTTKPAEIPKAEGGPRKSVYDKPFKKLFAIVKTDLGEFRIQLQPNQKPITTENFVRLAEGTKEYKDPKTGRYSKEPFYNGMTFHRAIRGTLIQSGCPLGDGRGGPGFTIQDESNDFDNVEAGSVLMARSSSKAKNSAGSQFYIMLRALPDLTDQDTIFGKVIEGLDVVRKISEVKIDRTDRPIEPVKIQEITIQKE